jgi:hypothetical protein
VFLIRRAVGLGRLVPGARLLPTFPAIMPRRAHCPVLMGIVNALTLAFPVWAGNSA